MLHAKVQTIWAGELRVGRLLVMLPSLARQAPVTGMLPCVAIEEQFVLSGRHETVRSLLCVRSERQPTWHSWVASQKYQHFTKKIKIKQKSRKGGVAYRCSELSLYWGGDCQAPPPQGVSLYSDLWQYKSLRAFNSSMRVLFWFSSTATRFSRHLTYSFFFLRHSRAASLSTQNMDPNKNQSNVWIYWIHSTEKSETVRQGQASVHMRVTVQYKRNKQMSIAPFLF